MASNVSTIKPGIVVNVRTEIAGNVSYQRLDIVTGEVLEDGAQVDEWKTKRTIEDPEELERATKVRGMARSVIEKICYKTSLGLMCNEDQKDALDAACDVAEAMVREFNRTATRTRVWFVVLPTILESNSERAMRSIMLEASRLVQEMDAGIKSFDKKKIRDAADSARQLSGMLDAEQQVKLNGAIEQARKAASTIVRRIEKEGEERATVLQDIQRGQIESARIAFLDMSGETGAPVEASPSIAAQRFADLEIGQQLEMGVK